MNNSVCSCAEQCYQLLVRGLLTIAFLPLIAMAQAPQLAVQPVYPAGPWRVDYSIVPAKGVSAAWIEVWDRPTLLYRTRVAVSEHGQIPMPDYEEPDTPDALKIAIFDPEVPLYCIDQCGDNPEPGHGETVSETVIGVSDPQYWDTPDLQGAIAQRVMAGSASPELLVMGHGFSAETKILLVAEDFQESPPGGSFVHTFLAPLNTEFVDLCTLRVTVPSGELLKPSAHLKLYVTNYAADDSAGMSRVNTAMLDRGESLYVAKPDSPVIEKMGPVVEGKDADERLMTLWGRNFSPHLVAHLGRDPDSFTSSRIDTEFISPSELGLRFDGDPRYAPQPLLWLVDDNDETRVSEPVELEPKPTELLKFDPNGSLVQVPAATICSVDPYPFELLEPSAPKFVQLRVQGHHFRPDDTVVVRGGYPAPDIKLKTTFVSEKELLARFPSELWRVHKISFRLLVRAGGKYYEAEVPDTD